ncbi:MAG: hypothetical protein E7272_07490 [Pseudobutyrivibrio ruminis]|uniref:Uncharacterized protein n=1 Tax=Pseudobutyrivibrio ruminis TaxID=46206 RepID=A0A927U7F9_9FIRM|nr:hypothetical protein [Pseudobutyrivibrio ruminis]
MIDYESTKAILNGEVECSAEDYDTAVADATKCINLLIEVAKQVNDSGLMSTFTVEKIRTKLNKEIKGSKECYVFPEQW